MRYVRILLTVSAAAVILGCGPSSTDASGPAASAPAEPAEPAAATVNCPVMPSMEVDVAQAVAEGRYVDHEGRRYVFCCAGCPEVFKRDPARFADAESVAIPDEPAG